MFKANTLLIRLLADLIHMYAYAGPEVIYFHGTDDRTVPYEGGSGLGQYNAVHYILILIPKNKN